MTGFGEQTYETSHQWVEFFVGASYGAGHIVQYVHYTAKVSFNEARAVCLEIGGDLAKTETLSKWNWISSLGVK